MIFTVSRSRSQICNSLAISAAEGRYFTISLSFSQSSKLIFIAYHKYLLVLQHCLYEVMVFFYFPLEFGYRVDNRVDLTPQFFFRWREKCNHVSKGDSPHHHHVNVTSSVICAPGNGAEDKRCPYFICLRRQR